MGLQPVPGARRGRRRPGSHSARLSSQGPGRRVVGPRPQASRPAPHVGLGSPEGLGSSPASPLLRALSFGATRRLGKCAQLRPLSAAPRARRFRASRRRLRRPGPRPRAALTDSASRRRPLSEQRKARAGRRARSPGIAAPGGERPARAGAGPGSASGSWSGGHMAAAAGTEARPRSLTPRPGGKRKPGLCGRRKRRDSRAGAHRPAAPPPPRPSCPVPSSLPRCLLLPRCPARFFRSPSSSSPPPLGPRLPELLRAPPGGTVRRAGVGPPHTHPHSPLSPGPALRDLLFAAPERPVGASSLLCVL